MDGTDRSTLLRDLWYVALPGRKLKPGKMVAKTMLGEPVVVARRQDGSVFALRDLCPHRGVPLSFGRVVDGEVECPYHGWRFDGGGRCTLIPSLVADQDMDAGRVGVRAYPCREVQGNIWVFIPAGSDLPDPLPPIVELPGIGEARPRLVESMTFDCAMDHAVIGLMDPAHGPFVHRSWFWRSRRSIHEKAKSFGPSELGFRMIRHAPSKNARAYRILGGAVSTEIAFRLPGLRLEHVEAGRHTLCGLTALTPVDERTTEVHHAIYWTMPWLSPLIPAVRRIARTFLGQDRSMVEMQAKGLAFDPPLMLINDADVQAKWYFRLKKEFVASRVEQRDFVNPVKERVLRWRS